jgi:quercetin dioxygenase-like cupin family protein
VNQQLHHAIISEVLNGSREPDAVDPQDNGGRWQLYDIGCSTDVVEVHYTRIRAGRTAGAHRHPDADHYIVVLSGVAHVWLEGEMFRVEAPDFIQVPRHVLHDFAADPSEDLWTFIATSPPFDPKKMQYEPAADAEIAAAFRDAFQPSPST